MRHDFDHRVDTIKLLAAEEVCRSYIIEDVEPVAGDGFFHFRDAPRGSTTELNRWVRVNCYASRRHVPGNIPLEVSTSS